MGPPSACNHNATCARAVVSFRKDAYIVAFLRDVSTIFDAGACVFSALIYERLSLPFGRTYMIVDERV